MDSYGKDSAGGPIYLDDIVRIRDHEDRDGGTMTGVVDGRTGGYIIVRVGRQGEKHSTMFYESPKDITVVSHHAKASL